MVWYSSSVGFSGGGPLGLLVSCGLSRLGGLVKPLLDVGDSVIPLIVPAGGGDRVSISECRRSCGALLE